MKTCYILGHKLVEDDNKCQRCHSRIYGDSAYYGTFWHSDTFDTIKIIFTIMLVTVLMFSVAASIYATMSKAACNQYADFGLKVIWKFWTGCMVEHPKFGWVPADQYFKILNINMP